MESNVSSDGSTGGAYVVFGGSGGIGRSVVAALAARDLPVVAAARDETRLREVCGHDAALTVSCDASSGESIAECLETAAREVGGGTIAGIAHCVGSILLKPAHLTSDAEWDETIERNLGTAFKVVRAAAKVMKKGGSVVLYSSAAAGVGLANHEAIAAAKAGIEGLVRGAAASYAARGLRVNAIAPGLVRTPMTDNITSNERTLESSTAMHALGRIGEPEDIARATVWLLDPANSWMTGQVWRVDGGLSHLRPVARARSAR